MWAKSVVILALVLCTSGIATPARAGIPVIDVSVLVNVLQQIMYWQQQIQSMIAQINQMKATYNAITGSRGMEGLLLLSNTQRNYLPSDYSELTQVLSGTSGPYAGLSSQVQSIMSANAILTAPQLSVMTPQMRQLVEQGRRSAALLQAMSRSAQHNTSQRFSALQQLINKIGAAADDKAIQDLQARITAEQTMLTNEQTKLQTLYQIAQADQHAQQQRLREQVVAGHGSFGTRFQPKP